MRHRYRWLLVATVMAAVIGVIVARMNRRAAQSVEHEIALVDARRRNLLVAVRNTRQQLSAAERESRELTATLASLQPIALADAAGASAIQARRPTYLELLRSDPKMQALSLASQRAILFSQNAALFRTLHLGEADQAKFLGIEMHAQERRTDLQTVMANQALTEDDPVIEKLNDDIQKERENAIRNLLGSDGYRAVEDYQRSTWVREIVSDLQGAATNVGVPFTLAQAEQLTQTLANASPSYRSGRFADADEVNWDQVAATARGFLSPEQAVLITTAEPSGLGGAGARYLTQLNHLVDEARKADAAAKAKTSSTP